MGDFTLGPVGVEPDVGVEVGVGGLVAEIGADKFLEVAAFFTLCLGGGAVVVIYTRLELAEEFDNDGVLEDIGRLLGVQPLIGEPFEE